MLNDSTDDNELIKNVNTIVCCECLAESTRIELFLYHWRNSHEHLPFPSAYTKPHASVN